MIREKLFTCTQKQWRERINQKPHLAAYAKAVQDVGYVDRVYESVVLALSFRLINGPALVECYGFFRQAAACCTWTFGERGQFSHF